MQPSKGLTPISLLNPHRNTIKWELLYLYLQMRSLRHRKVKYLHQGLAVSVDGSFWAQETWLLPKSLELKFSYSALTPWPFFWSLL